MLILPAKILPCGVGSSIVPEETLMYPAQPSSQMMTLLFCVDFVTEEMTLSEVSVFFRMLPDASYSVIVLFVATLSPAAVQLRKLVAAGEISSGGGSNR